MNPLFMFFIFILLCVVVVFFMYKSSIDAEKQLINKLWKNGEITDETYKKYLEE